MSQIYQNLLFSWLNIIKPHMIYLTQTVTGHFYSSSLYYCVDFVLRLCHLASHVQVLSVVYLQ